jgi:DNA topoisomerase-2
MTKDETIQKLTHIEHVLKRPDSYVGPVDISSESYWIYHKSDNQFKKKNVNYSPALLKIFDEILVNAIDRNSLHPKSCNSISARIDKEIGSVTIENNGPLGGIAVKMHEKEGVWNPELTFGHLLTSTNYDDTKKRIVGGRNGYGAKLTNIYSSEFSIVVKDHESKQTYTQKWNDNMTVCHPPKITKHSGSTSSVSITFIPDWKRFGMKKMDTNIYKIFEKRVWDANICTASNCKVKFQDYLLPKTNFESYAKMHEGVTDVSSVTTDRWSVCIGPSENGLEQVSFVNGISTNRGGTHVDHVISYVASGIIDDLAKKINLKPQQVKNTFNVFVKATLENPTFSSQVKSECTSKTQDFGSKFEPPKNFIKNVLKTGIQEELTALSKFKEMKELKKTDGGARKSKITGIPKLDDANKAGTAQSGKCTLIVTEGDSAKTLAVAGLSVVGRDHYGVFPLRGKCKNVRDASVSQLTSNQEFNDLKKILGLQQGKEYTDVSELRYGRLMIMTDADNDGSHIKGLILNMIHYFWPSLLKLGFVVSMVTPIIKASNGSETKSFYTDSAFRTWYGDGKPGWKIKYYKGLGTSTSAEAREYFKKIQDLTVKFDVDTMTDASIVLAFDKTKADDRKSWLLESTAKNANELEVPYGRVKQLGISDFVHKDLVNFSLADLKRSIAHVADGLKPSQRKVLFACFHKNLKEEMKVAQLAAYVADKSAYHHGEVSLADTIVKLANDYTGSNNINLLEPCGQFGTRLMGGKDASQTRYIFTKLTKNTRKLFDPRDDPILNYLDDDGRRIEPDFYMPTLPMVLVNGTEGIGTGFSCYVPPFNPKDIKENIGRILDGKELVNMSPWFRGFKGKVFRDDGGSWITEGIWRDTGSRLKVTELPPGRWTQDYKEYLDALVEKKIITNFTNNSTTDDVDFEIFGYSGKDIVKDLKLRKTFHVTNMHLFHPTRGIHKYSSPEEILRDFVELRVEHYKKRRAHLLDVLKKRAEMCDHKSKFVTMVIDGELIVFRRKRQDLERQMSGIFPKIDGNYDYLLNIKTIQYTEECVNDLLKEARQARTELETMSKTTHIDMWKMDIKNM